MNIFDYIKLGNYSDELGGLTSPITNQKMFMKTDNMYVDITYMFTS